MRPTRYGSCTEHLLESLRVINLQFFIKRTSSTIIINYPNQGFAGREPLIIREVLVRLLPLHETAEYASS